MNNFLIIKNVIKSYVNFANKCDNNGSEWDSLKGSKLIYFLKRRQLFIVNVERMRGEYYLVYGYTLFKV